MLEDYRKFGFENDVYSQEFFEFLLGVQKSVLALDGTDEAHKILRTRALDVASKTALEILASAYHNSCIDQHMALIAQLLEQVPEEGLHRHFL